MAASTKRAWKLQEFVAHGSSVNCLALGHKSGRVMVTGGDDKKVNMWAVGKPNCIMSLSGHTSPVEAVKFGNAEEMVVAGSMSGALKIWDLEAAKIMRTLTGHKSNIRSLNFHPYGDFVASGSLDSNIKLWDIRRKGCIFTYKGHTKGVTNLRFSPDGRWIASSSDDGLVKIWDLTAGKLLADLKQHTGPVTCIEFHPNEFLLASGSSDRTVKYWDLETFQLVSSTDGESSPIRCIFFHPEGSCLYGGATDMLKVYGWEPASCFDTLPMGWGKIADIAIAQNQLIGGTFSQTNVSTYVVDLQTLNTKSRQPPDNVAYLPSVNTQRVQPTGSDPSIPLNNFASPPHSASGRKIFHAERPPTQSSKRANPPKEEPEAEPPEDDPGDENESTADIKDPDDFKKIFNPKRTLSRSPTPQEEPFPAPLDDGIPEKEQPPKTTETKRQESPKREVPPSRQEAPKKTGARRSGSGTRSAAPQDAPPRTATVAPPRTATVAPPRTATVAPPRHEAPPRSAAPPKSAVPSVSKQPTVIPAERTRPAGLDAAEFLPKIGNLGISDQKSPLDMSEAEAVSSILKGHESMAAVMNSRHRNLQIIRALWTGGDIKTVIDSAIGMNDLAVIVDVLNILAQKQTLYSLDICALLLPSIKNLMSSKYENYVYVGCTACKVVLKNFGTVIKSNINAPPSIGVDISREERYQKCNACYGHLMSIRSLLDQKSTIQGKQGSKFRQVQLLMNMLE